MDSSSLEANAVPTNTGQRQQPHVGGGVTSLTAKSGQGARARRSSSLSLCSGISGHRLTALNSGFADFRQHLCKAPGIESEGTKRSPHYIHDGDLPVGRSSAGGLGLDEDMSGILRVVVGEPATPLAGPVRRLRMNSSARTRNGNLIGSINSIWHAPPTGDGSSSR